jgi:hypothetical protein
VVEKRLSRAQRHNQVAEEKGVKSKNSKKRTREKIGKHRDRQQGQKTKELNDEKELDLTAARAREKEWVKLVILIDHE